jgi:hypothetical protein
LSALDRIVDNLGKLPEVLEEYEQALDTKTVEDNLRIKGKVLETANSEQPGWLLYYDSRRAELYALMKWLESRLAAVRGKYFKQYTEHYSRELSDRQKDKYIDNEQQVQVQLELYLQVKELHDRFQAVVDAFQARGFALKNITELRIRSLEDSVI